MIVFDLVCAPGGHRFEGWFASRAAFDEQAERGLLMCAVCGTDAVERAPSAARLNAKGNQLPVPAATATIDATATAPTGPAAVFARLAEAQAAMLPKSRWVGDAFDTTVRAIARGEVADGPVHGSASPDTVRALLQDGLPVLPLVVPFTPPDDCH